MNHGQLPTQIMTEKPMQLYSSWDCELEVYVTYEHIHYFNNILSLKGHKVAVLINWLLYFFQFGIICKLINHMLPITYQILVIKDMPL